MADTNPGTATIQGAVVCYLYKAPTDKTELKNELTVLQAWLNSWNANAPDIRPAPEGPYLPNQTHAAPPVTRLLVTSFHHKSVSAKYAKQPKHISVYPCTDANWKVPEYGAHVHIFSVNEDPAQGYHSHYIVSRQKHALNSPGIQQALVNVQAHDLGTLGKGDLA